MLSLKFIGWSAIGLLVALGLVIAGAGPARSDVVVIELTGPPQLVAIPETPIQYAPSVNANYFVYDGRYYVFTDDAWYAGSGYNGPWVVMAPEDVPRPLLGVPVGYYRVQPAGWRGWRTDAPPRWESRWGRRWEARRFEGQALPRLESRDADEWYARHDRDAFGRGTRYDDKP